MFWFLLLISIALLVYLYKIIKKKQSYWAEKGVTHIKPTFLIGNSPFFHRKLPFPLVFKKNYDEFPNDRYYGNYNFLEAGFVIRDPQLIKEVTIKSFDNFMDHRTFADYEIDKFWGKNLITSKGERWRNMRATLSPSFTGSKMRIMFGLMEECAQQFLNHFKNNNTTNDIVDMNVKDSITRFTNDVIASTAFGIKVNSFANPENKFFKKGLESVDFGHVGRMMRLATYMFSPTLGKLLKVKIIPEYIEKYFTEVIAETLKYRKENNIQRPDMIHMLMEAQENKNKGEITLDDISSHAFLFFLAGFESVSTILTFFIYEVVRNPEIQQRLYEEIESVDGDITYDSLLKLKYLDMVYSETLRRWPATVFIERLVTKEFVIEPVLPHEKRVVLEEGMDCMMSVIGLHLDPKYFPDPEKFDPERFSDENKHKIDPATFIPFGAGPRICIGNRFAILESKLIIFHLLKNFELVRTEKTKIPMELDTNGVNLKIKDGLWIGLKPRKQ